MISDKENELKNEEIKRIESERDSAISSASSAMISHIEALINKLNEIYSADEGIASALSIKEIFTGLKNPAAPNESDSPIIPNEPEQDGNGADDFDRNEPSFDKNEPNFGKNEPNSDKDEEGFDDKAPSDPFSPNEPVSPAPPTVPSEPVAPDIPFAPVEPNDDKGDEEKSDDSLVQIIKRLEDILAELEGERAEKDFSRTASNLLSLFNEIESIIEDPEVLKIIADARAELVSFGSELDKKQGLLTELNKTFEEKSSARLEKFKNPTKSEGADVKKWQKEKEASVSSSWNEYKKQWQSERKQDLK